MGYQELVHLVTVMGALSVAVERSTEIVIHGLKLDDRIYSASNRRLIYQLMAAVIGGLLYWLNMSSYPTLLGLYFNETTEVLLAGLFVSGGSGFWHESLKFLSSLTLTKKETML